jgi:hypothetical protein
MVTKTAATPPEPKGAAVSVKPLNKQRIEFRIKGIAPYVMLAFSMKAQLKIHDNQEAGSTAGTKKKRPPRDFDDDYQQAFHRSSEGWVGFPASSIRNACISVCPSAGMVMTRAKLSIFVEGDGFDAVSGMPLIKMEGDEPERLEMPARNSGGGMDLRVRPMWREWGARVRIVFDGDQFTATDVANLLYRAGQTAGIGEGRPSSKNSNGMGWGLFTILGPDGSELEGFRA